MLIVDKSFEVNYGHDVYLGTYTFFKCKIGGGGLQLMSSQSNWLIGQNQILSHGVGACIFENMYVQKVYKHFLQRFLYGSYFKKNQKPSAASLTVNWYQFKSGVEFFNHNIQLDIGFFDPGIFQFFIFFGPVFKI